MAIIVEDGTGVTGANSYISLADARTYATNRGFELSADDTIAETQLVRAFDYVEGMENKYCGQRVYPETAFPRKGLTVNGFDVAEDQVPTQVGYAQVQVAVAINSGANIDGFVSASDYITKEVVGEIEVEYAEPTMSTIRPRLLAAEILLRQLTCFGVGGGQMFVSRF